MKEQIKTLLQAKWWEEEYSEAFSAELVIDFVNAPAGMKQHMDAFEVPCFFEWLRRTAKTWKVSILDFYEEADGNAFWSTGTWGGDVYWGHQDGHFEATYIIRIVVTDGKVSYVKVMTDPIAMLKAAGREVPIFRMPLDTPEIAAKVKEMAAEAPAPVSAPVDASPAACKKRLEDNIAYFMGSDVEFTSAPDCSHAVYFLPPEMRATYTPEELPAVEAWDALSCTGDAFFTFLPGKAYPTEDPHVFFLDVYAKGKYNWYGNPDTGYYHNSYLYILCVNDLGQITRYEEYMDTMNKFNSINTSIPTFPYYL